MRKRIFITSVTAGVMILLFLLMNLLTSREPKNIKVGFIYVGDGATAYTHNYMRAQEEIEERFGDQVTCVARYNVAEGSEEYYIQELIDENCDIIFGTSYGYMYAMKDAAKDHPDIQFCMATGDNANVEPVLPNYHTYMGHIAEGRYISGVVAGMKMNEMVDHGIIESDQCKIGYVAAYPYPEVISGYTAFLMGARSVCPDATMEVKYADTWSSYTIERNLALELIDDGCVIISQHSDTAGPAVACETSDADHPVFLLSYNASMIDVAPVTALTGCRINWAKYECAAIEAVLEGKTIESTFGKDCSVNGTDVGAGFQAGWVELLELSEVLVADGTTQAIRNIENEFAKNKIQIYSGPYIGVNPFDSSDVIDLSNGYKENEKSSAPTFHYVLNDIIEIKN